MKCIIHAGLHKTGTGAIQQAFQGFDDGVTRYANLGHPNHSLALQTLFGEDHLRDYWIELGLSTSDIKIQHDRLNAQFDSAFESSRQTVILSGENVCFLKPSELAALRERLVRHCQTIEVILVLRNPTDWAASDLSPKFPPPRGESLGLV